MKRDLFNSLTEKDFIITEDLWASDDNNNIIVASVEPKFNINKKFGLNIKKDDSINVIFFIEYDIETEDMLIVFYIIIEEDNVNSVEREYKPTDFEKQNILNIIDKYCRNAKRIEEEKNIESE